jgi:uncharacterized protein (TIGR03437 family)
MAAGCAGATNGQVVVITFTPATGTPLTVNATLNVTGAVLTANSSTLALSCDTSAGPTAGIVAIKTTVAGSSYLVTPTFPGGSPLAAVSAQTVASSTTAVNFSFSVAAGCAGATNGQTVVLTFTPTSNSATAATITVTATISLTSPALVSSVGAGITLSCDTVLGPTPVNIGITTAASATSYTVTGASGASTVVVVAPSSNTVSSTTVPVVWTLHGAAGCKGWVSGATVPLTFTPSAGAQVLNVTATLALTNSGTALAASPSSVTVTCTKTGSSYSSISTPTVNITSPANYGTPFILDASVGHAIPSYLSVTPATTQNAGSSAVALTVTANAGCGNLPIGNTLTSFSLANPPAADLVVPVTVQVGGAAPLTATAVSLTYVKGSETFTPVSSTLAGPDSTFYLVDPTTLPLWLNTSANSGSLNGSGAGTLAFLPTAGADTLALGTYTATVHLKVSGDLDSTVTVSLQVQSSASSIIISEGLTQSANWILGTAPPTFTITPISTGDAPISYTVSSAAVTHSLVPQVSASSGVAYSFGPALSVSFLEAPFSAAIPGETLSGTVTITWTSNGGGTKLITFTVTAVSPSAIITSMTPSSLPTATSGTYTVVITGSGFVTATGMVTNVGVLSGGLVIPDSNIVATVQNATTIDLAITVPTGTDPFLPFSGVGGTVPIAICNPTGASLPCYTPSSSMNLTIGVNPIVQAVTSSASYMQATPPALTSVAPYDMLSVFGINFCISNATGCTSNAILYGVKDPVTLRYLTQLSPDAPSSTQRNLTVTFQTHGAAPTVIATAPLLFATNAQINLLVPDAVKAYYGNTVDMVVSFGYGSGSTLLSSLPYSLTISQTNPGIFAMTGDGQGDAAALSASYALINAANPAGSNIAGSDTIALYGTGLGRPDGPSSDSAYSSTCMATDAYWAAVNTAVSPTVPLTSDDGLVLQSALFPANTIQPCISDVSPDVPTVTVGGVNAPVTFAGWVSGSVAGLYQINVTLPLSGALAGASTPITLSTTAQAVPVVITAHGKTSQPSGVNVWMVQSPEITVEAQSFSIAGGALPTGGSAPQPFTVVGGAAPTFSVSSGLPPGITMNSDGSLAGTPAAASQGVYTVTVNVTDTTGWTGTVSLTITITT